ncbi:MAG: LuxR C-terminal-related transcriptional regulator [Opitutaceae bacterium]
MMLLSQADQSSVFDALRELYAQTALGPLRGVMLRLATRLVANEWASYNEVERDTYRSVLNFRFPDSMEIQKRAPSLLACIHEHPGLPFGRNGSLETRTLSDFLSWSAFQRTTMFNEYYRHVGVRYQIFFGFDGGQGNRRTIALNRKQRDFSARDRRILDILSPHYGQAHANAVRFEQLRAGPAQEASYALVVKNRSAILRLTEREKEVLNWIILGKSNPEIAVILGLSVRTVYKHVENLFAKMGVESRAQAMVKALEDSH